MGCGTSKQVPTTNIVVSPVITQGPGPAAAPTPAPAPAPVPAPPPASTHTSQDGGPSNDLHISSPNNDSGHDTSNQPAQNVQGHDAIADDSDGAHAGNGASSSFSQDNQVKDDAMLTHDWGENGVNHCNVREINRLLNMNNVRTWFDEERIKQNIRSAMTKGINGARWVVVFVTKRYIEKIATEDMNDNCYFEFQHAANVRANKMIAVVMEPEVRNTSTWKGLLQSQLGGSLYIDMTDREMWPVRACELASTILERSPDDPLEEPFSQEPKLADPTLLEGIDGLADQEASDLVQQNLPEIVWKKLKDPNLKLDADQQIECLSGCILVGAARARKAKDAAALMVIGNTGAGKSTFVNYIHGCSMECFETDNGTAIRVEEASAKPELMPIGHTNQSKTFIPGIQADNIFTYMDCPGFMDNRGAEINIANAVNIKQAIHASKSVKVVVILNYYSLLSDRGKGLRDLAAILQDMFGTGERLMQHTASIALGLSQVPLFNPRNGQRTSILLAKQKLEDLSGLSLAETAIVEALRTRLFIFDPASSGDVEHGWSSREDLIKCFNDLEPIQEPSSIFQTVLTPEDERTLRNVVREIVDRTSTAMQEQNYEAAGATLAQLQRIELIDNALVTRLMGEAANCVSSNVLKLREAAVQALLSDDLDRAEKYLRSLNAAAAELERHVPAYARDAEKAAEIVEAQMRHHRKMAEERESLRRELAAARESRELLEKKLRQVESEQASYRAEVSRLQDAMHAVKEQKARELEAAAKDFQKEQEKIRHRLESAGEEDKNKLQQEIERLKAEQDENRRHLEERSRQQEEQLQKTLEENERLLKAREKEAAEVRQQQAEANEQERKRLTEAEEKAQALAMIKKGGASLAQLQGALRAHGGSESVAEKACVAVLDMCANNDNNQAEAGRLGLLADLQVALRGHSASAGVTEQACGAVWNMCANNNNNQAEAGRLGLLADLQAALRGHRASACVTEKACGAVRSMCANNNNNQAEAGRLGLLSDLQAALRGHRASAGVTEKACAAVWSMCANNNNNQAEAGRLGLLSDLQAALRGHRASASVTEEACRAVWFMCSSNNNNQAEAGRLGLLADLQAALRGHSASTGVTELACGAVWIMCANNNNNQAEAGRLELLADLQAALRGHSASAGVTKQARGAVRSMCDTGGQGDLQCLICCEKQIIRSLKCGHFFCQDCINRFPKKQCPVCGAVIVESEIRPLYL